jgi:Xaa-Pro aminopeptidase
MSGAAAQIGDRIDRLAIELAESGAEALAAWSPVSMGYLAGFFENAHERFMTLLVHRSGESALIAPALSASQAQRAGIREIRSWKDGDSATGLFTETLSQWGALSGPVLLDPDMPARMVLELQAASPRTEFRNGHEILFGLRSIKSDAELEAMRLVSRIVDEVFPLALEFLRPGMSEFEVAEFLRDEMKARCGKPTFAIVAAGPGSAEPHHISDETVIGRGQIVLMDFGCELNHYQSDVTRTVCLGSANEKQREVYRIVHSAHMAGRNAIRAGVRSKDVDSAARQVIEAAGYGDAFFHRLGHGIGMEGHEEPNIAPGNETVLRPGHCFSIEPGIYLSGEFGVRIENLVCATEAGHESLNAEPSAELIELG